MAAPLMAPKTDEDGFLVYLDGNLKVKFPPHDPGTETVHLILKADSPLTHGRNSPYTPPLHWHMSQTETFYVNAGTMAYTLDGREGTLGPGGSVTILPGSVHTFWMPDRDQGDSEDLDIVVTATGGGERGYGEEFARHYYGYLSHSLAMNTTVPLLHLLAFAYSGDMVLPLPMGLGRLANYVLGGILAPRLGYKTRFKEFEAASE